jgi:hypothetical protein
MRKRSELTSSCAQKEVPSLLENLQLPMMDAHTANTRSCGPGLPSVAEINIPSVQRHSQPTGRYQSRNEAHALQNASGIRAFSYGYSRPIKAIWFRSRPDVVTCPLTKPDSHKYQSPYICAPQHRGAFADVYTSRGD